MKLLQKSLRETHFESTVTRFEYSSKFRRKSKSTSISQGGPRREGAAAGNLAHLGPGGVGAVGQGGPRREGATAGNLAGGGGENKGEAVQQNSGRGYPVAEPWKPLVFIAEAVFSGGCSDPRTLIYHISCTNLDRPREFTFMAGSRER